MSDREDAPPPGVKTMAIVRWVLVAVTALVAAASILGYAGVLGGGGKHTLSKQLYHCPMHPAVVQDHPGQCPICNMTLVPRPAGDVKASATMQQPASAVPGLAAVYLAPERVQLIGMRTAAVKREARGGELRTIGVVAASEKGLAQITARFAGWIQKLSVATTGERVRRGQVLATIYSPDVLRAQQELLVVGGWNAGPPGGAAAGPRDEGGVGAGLAASARRRLELLGISAQEIDEIVRTGKAVEAIALRSPVDGYVVSKGAVSGVAIQPGTVLFEVSDLSRVWVTADVYELDIARIHVGQRARLELAAYPGETHVGKVQFVYPILDAPGGTLKVRIEIANRTDRSGPRLRPGMHGTVYLDLPATSGLMVPAEAVVDTGEMHHVFVVKDGGHFEPRVVKIGARAAGKVEITSGVTEGETVVTTGNFLIDSESRLRAAIEAPAARDGGP